MEIKATARKLRFGHCTLDEGRGVLIAPDGTETLLRPKTFELLRLMLRNPGRVVARNEILDAVWPGLFVTDDSITQCVVELRKAMGDAGAALLRTVPRRGYLLQAEVIAEAPPAPVLSPMLSPRANDRPSIAVLPFRMNGPDPQETYFCDGIIEGIVHVLSGLDGLFVVSRGSALAFAQVTTDARAAARDLDVRYVLYGGVRRAGGRLRIATELTDAERGTILRSDRYEGDEADIFALQDSIAEKVAITIVPQLREQELARAMRKPPTSLTAYDLVLRALDQARRVEPEATAHAEALLRQALAVEPGSTLARSNLALLHILAVAEGWAQDAEAARLEAARLAQEATEAEPADPLALAIRGHSLSYLDRDYAAAARLLGKAMDIGPSCVWAWAWGSATAGYMGQTRDALRFAERALALGPLDPFVHMFQHLLSQAHYLAGDHEAALAWARQSAGSRPRHAPNRRVQIAALVALGRLEEAREVARALLASDRGFSIAAFAARTPLPAGVREAMCDSLRKAGLPP